MSVIRSKRHISKFECENTFTKLYQFSLERTSQISKRKKKWLCDNINSTMNLTYNLIMELNEFYFIEHYGEEELKNTISQIMLYLESLEKPLMVLWNIEKYKTRTMAAWCELIENEYNLLYGMLNVKKKHKMKILDFNAINKAEFLRNMSDFHVYVHSKVIGAPNKYDDTCGALLIQLVDTAFYCLIKANEKIPSNKKEYQQRTKYILKSISALRKMQRQTLFYFNLMKYSESILKEWSEYLSTELKLLYALKKSDSKRFKNLK